MNTPAISSRLSLGILLVTALVALVIVADGPVQAQTPSTETVMVSNTDEDHDYVAVVGNNIWYAQSFCTGGTYTTLKKVRIYASDPHSMDPSVALHSAGKRSPSGNSLLALTNPTSFDSSYSSADDFTTTGYLLAPNTLYWIVAKKARRGTGWFRVSTTSSKELDSGGADGWSMGSMSSNWGEATSYRMRMAIYGESTSLPHHPARFPRSCEAADHPSLVVTVDTDTPANAVFATLSAEDPDGDSLTYSISGQDAAAFNEVFSINTGTGEIIVNAEAASDYGTKSRYSVRVNVTDGADGSGNAEVEATTDDQLNLRIDVRGIDVPKVATPDLDSGLLTVSSNNPRVGNPVRVGHTNPNWTSRRGSLISWSAVSADGNFGQVRQSSYSTTYVPEEEDVGKYLEVEWMLFGDDAPYLFRRMILDNPVAPATNAVDGNTANRQQQSADTPATGGPGIVGRALAGETLTATTDDIEDEDGLADAVLAYQWIRQDLATLEDTNIEGATSSTYTVTAEDEGKAIRVRVSFTDDAGNSESLTSYAVVASPAPPLAQDDDDPAVAVSFGSAAYSVTEGGTVEVTVALDADPERTVRVPLTVMDQDGASPADYSGVPASVTFASGEMSRTFSFSATQDEVDDDGERVKLTFGTLPARVSAGTVNASTVNIQDDDDPAVAVSFGSPAYCVPEGGTVEVTVALDADPERRVTVPLTVMDQDGASPADYSGVPASVTFAPGEMSRTFTFSATQDEVDDDGERVKLTFGTLPARVSAGTMNESTVKFESDTPLTASSHDAPASHDGSADFTFELRLSEEPVTDFSYKTLRDHAFTVTGGEVKGARRLDSPRNIGWQIKIRPASNGDVTVVLPVTEDCEADGAICTDDGKMLCSPLEFTVSGPSG